VAPSSIIRGTIIDDKSGAALGNVVVTASQGLDTVARVVTNEAGYFRTAALVDGDLVLSFRRLGYQSGQLAVDSIARRRPVSVAMTAVAERLEGITVKADLPVRESRLSGFDERAQRRMGGTYLRRADLDALQATRVSDVMRRVPGARVIDSSGVLLIASSRGYKEDLPKGKSMAPCVMRVGIDGQIREPSFPINSIDPVHIHGIEVYSGPATIPPEFGGMRTDSFCGLVMIWTRIQ
jgi:hypothetical protein